MPPSTLLQILIQLQSDLNDFTVCCIDANGCITDLLALYGDEVATLEELQGRVANFGAALTTMSDALEKFQVDSDKLAGYFDAQR